MYISQPSKTLTTLCFFCHILITFATTPPENIAISCGSSINTFAPDLRLWIGEPKSESPFPLHLSGKSSNSKTTHNLNSPNSVPYKTARISRQEFTYVITVKPGQKFIRLHFNHDAYESFERSKPIFRVKAGPYTLLSTLSSNSLTSEALSGLKQVKEYCVNMEDQELTITFSPAKKERRSDDFYAFINGIEVVSMPTGLYFMAEGEPGARVVGQKHRFYIDNTTALETVQRLNIGGPTISPAEDSNMFRGWDEDGNYSEETGAVSASERSVSYGGVKTNFAPSEIYQTTRSLYGNSRFSMNCLTWRIPVDLGFRYLIRLHYSEFLTTECRSNEFSILINNQIVEEDNPGVSQSNPVYRDYMVLMEGDKMAGKRNLSVTFQPKFESREKQFHGTLNGIEVFKLSNPDNSLAGIEPFPVPLKSTPRQKKSVTFYGSNLPATVITVILLFLNIAVYHIRTVSDSNTGTRTVRSSADHPCSQFSIDEIRSATNNFDPKFHIGSGGYGRVYKGSIEMGATVVAVKRLKFESRQGDKEFWTEIKMLSKIRHEHLVSLIGYCNDGKERLLVYQYMTRGTLSDHLYKINRHGKLTPPLSWEIRLKILIGAARGLYYLHSRHRVIHRDVKSSNILLDENWVAKISDFGLSKMGPANDSFTHISTNVKGTFGYLDPEYFLTHKLTRKSDVYAFGVVLFEVLSGRPALNMRLEEEQRNLAEWARYCIREGRHGQLVDPNLTEQISIPCLKVFLGIAGRCLHTKPQGRPAMADVAMGLELALALQQNPDQAEEEEHAGRSFSDHSDGVISMDDITPIEELEIERIASEDKRNKGSDQKNGKARTKDSNSSTKWWWDPFGILLRSPSKPKSASMPPQEIIQQFSFQEIQKATNNFHNSLIIGFGGADSVYRGYIDGGQKGIAIRRSRDADSRFCMAHELQSKKEFQFQTNSSTAQCHVAFLIGCCETEQDMMLVYDYMEKGTLHDHLHESCKDPLTWKRRLEICIGAAKGLSYIHSKVKQATLHRDLKSSNIWLDENWNVKVSDWGLSKKKGHSRVNRGKWGYMDSDYIRGEELTEKSYVYSIGLVMFEVLFADKDTDRWLEEDQVSLAQWIKSCMRSNLSGCIDPFLVGRTSPDSIKTFVETARRCLLDHGIDRPSMSDIVTRLEVALKQQDEAEGNKGAQLVRS